MGRKLRGGLYSLSREGSWVPI